MFFSSRTLRLAAVAPALICVVGCAKPTPVGKWSGTLEGTGPSTLEFTKENTVSLQGAVKAPVVGSINIDARGTYTLDGEKIAIKIADVQSGGKSILSMIPANLRGSLDQSTTWKVEGDTLTLGSATLTRVK